LFEAFESVGTEHQERLYKQSRKEMTHAEKRREDRLEKASKPQVSADDLREKALLILPQVGQFKQG